MQLIFMDYLFMVYQEVCQRLTEHHQTLFLLRECGSGRRTGRMITIHTRLYLQLSASNSVCERKLLTSSGGFVIKFKLKVISSMIF